MNAEARTQRFYEVLWPHLADVLHTAKILCGNSAEAEDLAQEAMLKAFRAIDSLRDDARAKPWLMEILRNTRLDRLRSSRASARDVSLEDLPVEPADVKSDDPPAWNNPEAVMESFSDRQMIAALQKLPEEIRWTLLLVDVKGMDQADAAKLLEVPVGTIKSRAHRGRAMLRQSLTSFAAQAPSTR